MVWNHSRVSWETGTSLSRMKKYWALNGKRHQVPLLAHSVVLPHLKRQNRNRTLNGTINICEGIEVYALTGEADDIQRHAADPREDINWWSSICLRGNSCKIIAKLISTMNLYQLNSDQLTRIDFATKTLVISRSWEVPKAGFYTPEHHGMVLMIT